LDGAGRAQVGCSGSGERLGSRPALARGSGAGTGAGGVGAELEQTRRERELGSAALGGVSVDAAPGGVERGVRWPCQRA
jgi:hypothetical protein